MRVTQDTRYPWDGDVRLTLTPAAPGRFTLRLRVPGWARNEPSPSDLYRFADTVSRAGDARRSTSRPVPMTLDQGYAVVTRDVGGGRRRAAAPADAGPPRRRRRSTSPPIAAAWRCSAARSSTPPNGPTTRRAGPQPGAAGRCAARAPSSGRLLNGVEVITGTAVGYVTEPSGKIVKREQPFTAIPYCAWANRGPGEMAVWIPDAESAVRALPRPRSHRRARLHVVLRTRRARRQRSGRPLIVVRPVGRLLPLVAAQGHHRVARVHVSPARPACRKRRCTGTTIPATARCASLHRGASSTRTAANGNR